MDIFGNIFNPTILELHLKFSVGYPISHITIVVNDLKGYIAWVRKQKTPPEWFRIKYSRFLKFEYKLDKTI